MGTRVLSLWLPYLEIDRRRQEAGRRAIHSRRIPEATCDDDRETSPLLALCPLAERAGLRPGMARADALSRVPGLIIHTSHHEDDQRFLEACAAWCERYTPFVAIDRSAPSDKGGALWLDIGGSAHLAGGEAGLLVDLIGRFRQKGVTAKAAIADHPGSAWAACRFGDEERRIQAINGAQIALAQMPVNALRLERETVAMLEDAGLDRIEDLYALRRYALAERFGQEAATRLDQALGLIDEPIATDHPLPAQQAQMIFADPITTPNTLPPLIERLVHQLCVGLEAAGLGAIQLTLALYRLDNSTVTISIGVDRPCLDPGRLAALIGDRFDEIDLGLGLERMILDAVEIEPLLSENIHWRGLGSKVDIREPDPASRPCLESQSGPFRFEPCQKGPRDTVTSSPSLPSFGRQATALALSPPKIEQARLRETPPRPLRLLRRPEPIEAIAALPDEPPLLFRWRNRLHKIVGAKGPETISPDRWTLRTCNDACSKREPRLHRQDPFKSQKLQPTMRDYFAVENSEGERFWVFREGRVENGLKTLPRWFLHGLFGQSA